MVALPLNTAPHFVFYYRFCYSLDFYCSSNPKELFLSFSRTFCDYQRDFFKIQGQFKDKLHFFRIPGVFKDQGHFQGLFKVCANPGLEASCIWGIWGGANPSPFTVLSFSDLKKKPIYCWDKKESFLAAGWPNPDLTHDLQEHK